jgi:SAM-dependent methyltransferase
VCPVFWGILNLNRKILRVNEINKRLENLPRLNTFESPSIKNADYLHIKTHFDDLKNIFNIYLKQNDLVFDIGCGNKPFEPYIRKLIESNEKNSYIGCDIVQSSENKVDILCEATNIPVTSESYDVVICTQVLEHVFDHQKLLEEAYRLLKPGGRFIISAPFIWEMHEIPFDFFRFTKFGFETMLKHSGFEIKECVSSGGKWATIGQLLIQCFIKRGHNFIFRILRGIWNRGLILFCNTFFYYLENRYKNTDRFVLNYILVGEKLYIKK